MKRYPKKGEIVKITVNWGRMKFSGIEVQITGKPFRARSGAVLCQATRLDTGQKIYIPWTSNQNIIKFEPVGGS